MFHIDQHGPKDWWATYPWQYKSSCINLSIEDPSKQTITEHLLKSLMLGQPTLWVAYPKLTDYLEELGFSNYKWINYDFDLIQESFLSLFHTVSYFIEIFYFFIKKTLVNLT